MRKPAGLSKLAETRSLTHLNFHPMTLVSTSTPTHHQGDYKESKSEGAREREREEKERRGKNQNERKTKRKYCSSIEDANSSRACIVKEGMMRGEKGIIATCIYSSNKSITNCGMTCTPSP